MVKFKQVHHPVIVNQLGVYKPVLEGEMTKVTLKDQQSEVNSPIYAMNT